MASLVGLALLDACADAYPPLDHHEFKHDGLEREYFVHAPPGTDGSLPVILAIHGYTSTATGWGNDTFVR